jgi:hypothetical protein
VGDVAEAVFGGKPFGLDVHPEVFDLHGMAAPPAQQVMVVCAELAASIELLAAG